jgi:hypothetical protein
MKTSGQKRLEVEDILGKQIIDTFDNEPKELACLGKTTPDNEYLGNATKILLQACDDWLGDPDQYGLTLAEFEPIFNDDDMGHLLPLWKKLALKIMKIKNVPLYYGWWK